MLGDGQNYEGFINKKLQPSKYYKIFVRAYVDTPQKHLYTSSPFSPEMSLDMMQVRLILIIDLFFIPKIADHTGRQCYNFFSIALLKQYDLLLQVKLLFLTNHSALFRCSVARIRQKCQRQTGFKKKCT